jgi:hypothetical protein
MRKRPWELHAIICLYLLIVGAAASGRWFGEIDERYGLTVGAMALSLVGLFRGNRFAWWITPFVFTLLSISAVWMDLSLIWEYGFRFHWRFRNAHALVLLCGGTLGLLLSCRFRRAMPPVAPAWEDAPVLRRIAAIVVPVLFLGAALCSFSVVTLVQTRRGYGDYSFSSSLKTLASAEADFRMNDRDENHRNDFWTGDVQGLYAVVPQGGATPIKLIELSIALADGDPLRGVYPALPDAARPKAGSWYAALVEDRGVSPTERYRSPADPHHPSKFGFLGYPDDYFGGRCWALMVNENNTIFRRLLRDELLGSDRLPPGPVRDPEFLHFPTDEELKASWSKLD